MKKIEDIQQWQTQATFERSDTGPNRNAHPSQTVPDMTMTLKEIVERYRRGQAPPVQIEAEEMQMTLDDDPMQIPEVDFTELLEVKKQVEDLKSRLKEIDEQQAYAKEQNLKEDLKELDKLRAQQAENDPNESAD